MFGFLVAHGEVVLFVVILLEQAGLPLPSLLFLIAAGALVGAGSLDGAQVIGLSFLASLLADLLWFEIGRRGGMRVLGLLCRISFEPDTCVRQTQEMVMRHGLRSLLIAKFIPGFSTIAPPLVGVFRLGLAKFLIYDSIGALIWVVVLVGVGYAFSDQLELMAMYTGRMGLTLGIGLTVVLAAYLLFKYVRRRIVLRRLSVGRITPEELQRRLGGEQPPVVVDLRHDFDLEAHPYRIPGALRFSPEEILDRHEEIPREREIVLYCS
jgi:membrane protein DedA with SNARE-associated domain